MRKSGGWGWLRSVGRGSDGFLWFGCLYSGWCCNGKIVAFSTTGNEELSVCPCEVLKSHVPINSSLLHIHESLSSIHRSAIPNIDLRSLNSLDM